MKKTDSNPSSSIPDSQWPAVSFAMATYNSGRTLEKALASIREQDYPADVEIVIADGGSTDKSIEIAKKFGAKVTAVPADKQNAEYNKGVAVSHMSHDFLVMTDHDNILPHKDWLKAMIQPLLEDKEIFGTGVLRFQYDRSMTALDRYFALMGATDPIPFFFNKSGHQSYLYDDFHLRGRLLEEHDGYYTVAIDPERLPALGGNGSVLRRSVLKDAQTDPDYFFHIDIHVDLAKKGHTRYAFVKESIKHLTNNNLIPFLKRRKYFMQKYHFEDHSRRRYSVYEPDKDKAALIGYLIYSLTFVGPLYHSIVGFLKIRDGAWFIHPIMCFSMMIVYGYPTVREGLRRVFLGR